MTTTVVTCFSEFVDKVTTEPRKDRIFRGVSDISHQLVPPIGRSPRWARMTRERLAREERAMLKRFSEEGAAYVEGFPTLSDWMVIARHHGVPVRLLSWSRSPLVALWFACQGEPTDAGAVYVEMSSRTVGMGETVDPFRVRRISKLLPKHVYASSPTDVCCQTVYTVHPDARITYDSSSLQCLRISGKLKRHLKTTLGQLGVNPATLYPGLEGVARSIVA